MKFSTRQRRRAPAVIIVSLIDVLLVVLIFLMVTTTFRAKTPPALKLALPEAKSAQPGASKDIKPVVIAISTNFPFFYLDNNAVTFDRLEKELKAAVQRDPALTVAIKADKRAPFGEVVRVIDAAKLANVRAINAFTEKVAGK